MAPDGAVAAPHRERAASRYMSADFAFDARGTSETSASEGDHGAEPSPSGCVPNARARRTRARTRWE